MAKVTNILLAGVGGQGTLLASEVLSEVLMLAGYDVKKNEIQATVEMILVAVINAVTPPRAVCCTSALAAAVSPLGTRAMPSRSFGNPSFHSAL